MKNFRLLACSAGLVALLLLAGCGSGPATLQLGERTQIRMGLTGVNMDLLIERPGFYLLYTEGSEDTVCSISDVTDRQVAEDDDSGEGYNCLISTILDAGQYTVEVRGYDFSDHGRSHVTIERLVPQQFRVGEVVNLSLQALRRSVLELHITEAGAYKLGTSGMFDTECWLYDSSGVLLAHNDDFGRDLNCGMIERLHPGRYNVLVLSNDGTAGNPVFMASLTEVRKVGLAVGLSAAERLADPEDMVDFEVDVGEAGRYVFFTTGETDTYCELRGPDWELLAFNDDGEDQNCRIAHALNPGIYRFNVRGYLGAAGAFVAQVSQR